MTRTYGWDGLVKSLIAALAVIVASRAVAQQASATPAQTSDAFERACTDLIHGIPPKGDKEAEALWSACTDLMKARAEERRRAEQQVQARAAPRTPQRAASQAGQDVKAGQSTAPAEPGQSALAAFGEAGNELFRGRGRSMGLSRTGAPFRSTLITNPVAWFNGVGVNAEYQRSLATRFAWSVGAHYSRSNSVDTSLYTLGALGGVDWFILGKNNEGLRIGPRLDYSFGREALTEGTGTTDTRQRLGLAGEVGYNFIANNAITGQAALGVGGRISGDKNEELNSGFGGEFGPYVKLGVGYSW